MKKIAFALIFCLLFSQVSLAETSAGDDILDGLSQAWDALLSTGGEVFQALPGQAGDFANTEQVDEAPGQRMAESASEAGETVAEPSEEAEEAVDSANSPMELPSENSAADIKWQKIMDLWQSVQSDLSVHFANLPDGLDDTDALCLVVLGYQLNRDGSMQDELIERLIVALTASQKYPNALIVCTGGGTAADNPAATEAGSMAQWLIDHGVDADRVIVEDSSLTTAKNAVSTFDILEKQYPQVKQLAIISSDYHIASGVLFFGAEAILRDSDICVVSNAAYKAPSNAMTAVFQAGPLIVLSGIRTRLYGAGND